MATGDGNKNGVLRNLQEASELLRADGQIEMADRLLRDRWIVSSLINELAKAHELLRIALACLHDTWRLQFIDRVIDAGLNDGHSLTRVSARHEALNRARGEK